MIHRLAARLVIPANPDAAPPGRIGRAGVAFMHPVMMKPVADKVGGCGTIFLGSKVKGGGILVPAPAGAEGIVEIVLRYVIIRPANLRQNSAAVVNGVEAGDALAVFANVIQVIPAELERWILQGRTQVEVMKDIVLDPVGPTVNKNGIQCAIGESVVDDLGIVRLNQRIISVVCRIGIAVGHVQPFGPRGIKHLIVPKDDVRTAIIHGHSKFKGRAKKGDAIHREIFGVLVSG